MSSIFALTTYRWAAVDALRSRQVSALTQFLAIALFAGLTAVGAQMRIYLWEVPITLQTVFVYGSGLCLGARNGFLSMLLYLLLGMVLPVFAGAGYGMDYLVSTASAGYLLGMPIAALVAGKLSERWNSMAGSVLSLAAGSFVLFSCGVAWLHHAAGHATWFQSIDHGFLRFLVFDAAKILCVVLLYHWGRSVR